MTKRRPQGLLFLYDRYCVSHKPPLQKGYNYLGSNVRSNRAQTRVEHQSKIYIA